MARPFSSLMRCLAALPLAGACCVALAGEEEEYRDTIRPLLTRKCQDCHGPEKKKGDLDLAVFTDLAAVKASPEIWQNVLQRVLAYEMPPKSAPELGFDQHATLVKWLRALPKAAGADCDQLASDRTASFYHGEVMSRRLNRAEYTHTLRDLLGIDFEASDLLPADGGGGEGFDTTGSALFTSTIHVEKYLRAAASALAAALPDSARGLDRKRAAARNQILIAQPRRGLRPREAAQKVVEAFVRRAFRRPPAAGEVERFLTLFDRAWKRGDGYVASVRLALQGVLVSPHFLFLVEPESPGGGVQRLGAFPLASRLSYFLWSSMPDAQLLARAEDGSLLDTNVCRLEIRRMLADPKAEALGERFALQWLDLDRLGTAVRPDPVRFPEFDDRLASAMKEEAVRCFNRLFREDRSLLELIDSRETYVNERLARIYGLEGIRGEQFRLVRLEDLNRGGLVGMPAVHAMNAYPLRTSPVLRGRWILESLLGERVPPPPPGVPKLEESAQAHTTASLRQQLEEHRRNPDCASCHDRMDPLGFGLESFDILGRWRTHDRGLPVDVRGTLPSGQTFDGPRGLKEILLARRDAVVRHVARKMTGFAFGRELNQFDQCVIDRAMEQLKANDYRAPVLVETIVLSYPFQHRFHPKPEP
jgi:mono/diheme cytochrome c family protein